jgi:hypothetical protein
MAKKSILCLEETLWDLGYYPEHINSYIHTIDQILQRGIATINRNPGCNRAARILKRGIARIDKTPGCNWAARFLKRIIASILKRGIAIIDKRPSMISAAGIRPLFKINPKSIDVFLITTGELNVLRIFHPSNPFYKGESEAGCYVGNQQWLALNYRDINKGPYRGFYFTNFKYITSDYSSSI